MVIDGLYRNVQSVSKLGIGVPVDQQREHLDLARCESGRIAARRGARAAWNSAHTEVAQPLAHDCGQRAGGQLLEDAQ